jgi:hypothetical protein
VTDCEIVEDGSVEPT